MAATVRQINVDGTDYDEIVDLHPYFKNKLDYFNKQGWGYKDSSFALDKKKDQVYFTGDKYLYSGYYLPEFWNWVKENVGIVFGEGTEKPPQEDMEIDPPRNTCHPFLNALNEEKCFSRRSFEKWERIMHSHGATVREVFALRYGRFERYVDVVVYPISTDQVEKIVKLANVHNVVLIPYGGGTNVTQALYLNTHKNENRMIVSLDMSRMNKILWVDKDNMIACVQAGIRGQDLERDLKMSGVVSGHEPDSSEYSTLGGWCATRASGMKKNTYGNIEDIVQGMTFVTSKGTYKKQEHWPRVSAGPDVNQLILGQEGNYGVVTEVIIRVRPVPEVTNFASIIFPSFEIGQKFMEEMSKQQTYPSSLRLVDNIQFQFGQALKPAEPSQFKRMINAVKKAYVLNIAGFEKDTMCAATALFEGDKIDCERREVEMLNIAKKYGGLSGGAENGIKGYQLTYMIAYIRDFCLLNNVIAESFETSCPWSQVGPLCKNVRQAIFDAGIHHGQKKEDMFVSFRVTQLYETGAAVYVYFSITYDKIPMEKVVDIYEDIEHRSREATFKYGGSISHHHGVGKLRKRFMSKMVSPINNTFLEGIKGSIDPQNIFAANNTIYRDEEERLADMNHSK